MKFSFIYLTAELTHLWIGIFCSPNLPVCGFSDKHILYWLWPLPLLVGLCYKCQPTARAHGDLFLGWESKWVALPINRALLYTCSLKYTLDQGPKSFRKDLCRYMKERSSSKGYSKSDNKMTADSSPRYHSSSFIGVINIITQVPS